MDASTGSFRNKDEVFVELVASEERYHASLKNFCEVCGNVVKLRNGVVSPSRPCSGTRRDGQCWCHPRLV